MNRAQRRLAERRGDRQRAQRQVSPAEAWMAQKIAIAKSDRSDLDDASKREMLTTVYACLNRLIDGSMDAEDFMHVVEMNAVAGEIAYQLQDYDQTGQIAAAGFKCLAAAEALQAVGTRRGRAGKFGVAGDELGAIREAVEYLRELLDLAPRGIVVAAMDKIRRHMNSTASSRATANLSSSASDAKRGAMGTSAPIDHPRTRAATGTDAQICEEQYQVAQVQGTARDSILSCEPCCCTRCRPTCRSRMESHERTQSPPEKVGSQHSRDRSSPPAA